MNTINKSLKVNPNLVKAEYAVRGKLVQRAQELQEEGREITFYNIGNPHALKQIPLTYVRQYLSLVQNPDFLSEVNIPNDIKEKVKQFLEENPNGTGAYTQSQGFPFVRKAVAEFIQRRDGIEANLNNIFLTDGASKGVQALIQALLCDRNDGIMIPIPQYPLYSATIKLYGGQIVGYHLNEENNWQLEESTLVESYENAINSEITPKAIAVINPGNPTGNVLSQENIQMIIKFAQKYNLPILADEVYQENIYQDGAKFYSFAKVMAEMNITDVPLASFHSVSKGILGECGQRGGYFELRNSPQEFLEHILKLQSIGLCSNTTGQLTTYMMVNPPKPGDESFKKYQEERNFIFNELKEKSHILNREINKIPGMSLNMPQGAMYAFVKIELPIPSNINLESMSIEDQESFFIKHEFDYCLSLLEETGICIVPGSGFGQKHSTLHFRTTFLPQRDKIVTLVEKLREFHQNYILKII